MGLKSGSRDAGLDGDEEGETDDGAHDPPADDGSDGAPAGSSRAADAPDGDGTDGSDGRPTVESLPYTLRRGTVNEGRSQVPFFLRDEVVDAESDLQDALEETLGEEVYKSDYREAGMVVAQRHPELVAEVLREWGYDLEEG